MNKPLINFRPTPKINLNLKLAKGLSQDQIVGVTMAIRAMKSEGGFILADGTGAGKAQPLDAKILTPSGWKLMGDLSIGDKIFAADGTITKITGIFPQGIQKVFKVVFSDDSFTESTLEHLWTTKTWDARRNHARGLKRDYTVKELSEIAKTLHRPRGQINHSIPLVKSIKFPKKEIAIDPYVLGVLLGDGGLSRKQSIILTSADQELLEEVKKRLPYYMRFGYKSGKYDHYLIKNGTTRRSKPNIFVEILRHYKLLGKTSDQKFIPDDYKFNNESIRLEVLRGLMDTDGYISKHGHTAYFYTTSKQLSEDVSFLVRSLGGITKTKIKHPTYRYKGELKNGKICYSMTVSMPPHLNPFLLSRKANKVIPKTKYVPIRYIKSVEPAGFKFCQCISVEHKSQLYVTDDLIVTHNTRSALAVADYFRKLGNKVLIIAPAEVLKPNWNKRTFGGSYSDDAKVMGLESPQLIKSADEFDEYGISTYSRNQEIFSLVDKETILILDESHSLKNQTSIRSQQLGISIEQAKAVMFVSATPYDKPEEIFYLKRAGVFEGKTFRELMDSLGLKRVVKEIKRAPYELVYWLPKFGITKEEVNLKIERLFDRLATRGLFLRRELSLEGTSVSFREIEVPKEGLDQVDAIEGHYVKNGIDDKPTMLGHQRRLLENWKIEPAIEIIKNHVNAGKKVLVFTARIEDSTAPAWPDPIQTKGTAPYLREQLDMGDAIVELHGKETLKSKQKAIERFNNDETCRVMIATTESGGVGLNLDDRVGDQPRVVVFLTAPFGGIATVQAMGRCWRLTTKGNLIIEFLFCYHEVDFWNRLIIEKKLRQLAAQIKNPRLIEMFEDDGDSRKIQAIINQKCPSRRAWQKEDSLLGLLPWSTPKTIFTKNGKKILRTAKPDDAFWQQWKANKEALKIKGISVMPDAKRQWQVSWWLKA